MHPVRRPGLRLGAEYAERRSLCNFHLCWPPLDAICRLDFPAQCYSPPYRYILWTITQKRTSGSVYAQAAEFTLRSAGGAVTWGAGADATNNGTNSGAHEGPWKAIDGNETNVWCSSSFTADTTSVFGYAEVLIDNGVPLTFDSYTWTTGGDLPDRDPVSWSVYGSPDNVTWDLLDTRTAASASPTQSRFASVGPFYVSPPTGPCKTCTGPSKTQCASCWGPSSPGAKTGGFFLKSINGGKSCRAVSPRLQTAWAAGVHACPWRPDVPPPAPCSAPSAPPPSTSPALATPRTATWTGSAPR